MAQASHPFRLTVRRGLSSVELVLILPLLLLLLFGVIEYGWVFFQSQKVAAAARHGVRIGVTADATNTEIEEAVTLIMTRNGMDGSGYTLDISADTETLEPGDVLQVSVSVPYSNVMLVGFPFIPVPENLSTVVNMAKEGP